MHAPKSFGSVVLTDAVVAFTRAQPTIRVSLVLGDFTFRPYDFIEYGFDIGIRISAIRDSSLIARKIGIVESVLCASPGYLKRHGHPKSVADLAAHACLANLNLAPQDRVWTFQGPKGARSVHINGMFYSNSALALRTAALAGAGIAVLPTYCVRRDLADGALVRLLPHFKPASRPVLAVRPRSLYRTDKMQLFVDFLVRWFERRDALGA